VNAHYTELAESDLLEIAAHTALEFGAEQRDLYLRALEEACEHMLPVSLDCALRCQATIRPPR
jgi:plasmid stabilization system protein ParE